MEEKNTVIQQEKYIIWHVQGGFGKNVAATALIPDLKTKYPDRKIIMVVSYPEIFLNFKEIYRVYDLNRLSYFYEDYIENKDSIIFKSEPYEQTNHILRKQSLIKTFCDILGIKPNNQLPIIKYNYPQKHEVYNWSRPKPILLLQTTGGPLTSPPIGNLPPQPITYNWARDLPYELSQKIVDKYSSQYHIIQVTNPSGYRLQGIDERLDQEISKYQLISLVEASTKRILIDSSIQHIAAGLGLASDVFWIATSPITFGYQGHNNIVANLSQRANQLIGSYIFDYEFAHNNHECPFSSVEEIFDIDQILKTI